MQKIHEWRASDRWIFLVVGISNHSEGSLDVDGVALGYVVVQVSHAQEVQTQRNHQTTQRHAAHDETISRQHQQVTIVQVVIKKEHNKIHTT